MCLKILGTFFAILIIVSAILIGTLLKSSPQINVDSFAKELEKLEWSSDSSLNADTSIRPFQIKISKDVIKDLKQRLENVRLNEPLDGIQQQYGMNTILLREIIDYWKTKYNWAERENYLNKYQQFKTKIQGLDIHFIRVKPNLAKNANKQVLPLLLLHGWPGSVREFYEIVPFLTTPREEYDFVFELIIPSLPGYGFSQASSKPGLGASQMAVIFKLLMGRLGFDKFYVQGGDFGAIIIESMGKLYPDNLLGIHSNMCIIKTKLSFLKEYIAGFYPSLFVPNEFVDKLYPLSTRYQILLLESGYFHIQATKPDTVGVGLGDSPAGLAAYILEKFATGTNITYKERLDGGLKEKFTYDSLLDNVMLYWLTNSMTSAMRLYSETFNIKHSTSGLENAVITSPSACTTFLNEISFQSEWILKEVYVNLIHTSTYTTGGHFAAMENPKILANDIFIAIDKMLKLKVNK